MDSIYVKHRLNLFDPVLYAFQVYPEYYSPMISKWSLDIFIKFESHYAKQGFAKQVTVHEYENYKK